MEVSVGCDIVEVKRIRKLILNNSFLKKVYSEKEIVYCSKYKEKWLSFAGKFAAKEAFVKAYSKFYSNIPPLNKIEILNDKSGRPYIKNTGKKFKIDISISHTDTHAIAVCVIYK